MTDTKIKHIKSAVRGKVPSPETLDYGQIAVNYNAEEPFLSIKDTNDQIAKFPSEAAIETSISGMVETILPEVVGNDYYTKAEVDTQIADAKLVRKQIVQELPDVHNADVNTFYYVPIPDAESGSTNVYQEYTIIDGHWEALGTTDVDLDGYATEQWVIDQHYLTEHQDISGLATKQELSEGLSGKSNTGHTHTVSDITNFPTIPSATSDLKNDSGYITSGYTYSKTESDNKYALKGDVPTDVYTKQETDEAISGATQDMATKTWVGEQGYLTEHQSLANYYTKDETSGATQIADALSLKANSTDIPDVADYFDDAQYDSNTQRINFYHGSTVKAYIDASPFIVDGMIEDVRIETVSGDTYLIIDFNTQSGKDDIYIPISEIFNASNYYTKAEVDSAISGATDDMATKTWVGQQGYLTQHQSLADYYTKSQVDSEISGATTDMATQTWVQSQNYLTQHQDISGLATKQEVSELSASTDTKLDAKVDNADFLSFSGSVVTMLADKEKKAWMGTQEQYAAISGSTDSDRLYLITDGNTTVDLTGYYSKSQVDALLQALDNRITALETE